jgi:drug/metabolite transporter (DMT)-like permease
MDDDIGDPALSLHWMLVVLLAALLHASWNAMIKAGAEKFADTVLVTMGAAFVAALTLPWISLPATSSWPYLAASVLIHFGYFSFVALAYKSGDLSYAYPMMRGVAPLLTALVASIVLNEPLTPGGKIGIVLLSSGILTLTGDNWRSGQFVFITMGVGLMNAIVIAVYTLVDGIGIRLAGNAPSYISWLFFLTAFPFLALSLLRGRQLFADHIRNRWRTGLVGGFCTFCSYGLVLWAMIHLPIALVAALREMSVIFGTLIASVFLRERFGPIRYLAAALVAAGAIVMKLF